MKITDEIIDRLIRAAESVMHHDGYSDPEIETYVYKNLRKEFGEILHHQYAPQPTRGAKIETVWCKECRSYAINHNLHGHDGSDPDLCDVCYWRKRADWTNAKDWMINKLSDGLGEAQRLIDNLADRANSVELGRISAHISGVFIEIESHTPAPDTGKER